MMKKMNCALESAAPQETAIADIHVAAFLLARGYQIVRVDGIEARRDFVFANVTPEAITAFYGGSDEISARAILDAFRNLKGLLALGGRR